MYESKIRAKDCAPIHAMLMKRSLKNASQLEMFMDKLNC